MGYANKHNQSLSDIRVLKILKSEGPLSRKDLASLYAEHMLKKGMTGVLSTDRVAYLLEGGFIAARQTRINGLPNMVYELMDAKSLQRYIDLI